MFVINSLEGGGAERIMTVLLAASREMAAQYDLSLVLLDRAPIVYAPPAWLAVHQLDCGGSLVRSARQFHALAGREKPDLTVSFLTRANAVTVAASRRLGFRAVISERVNSSAHFGRGLRAAISKMLVRLSYPRAAHIVAVSQGVADDLVDNFGVPRDRITAIANPVDIDAIVARGAQSAQRLMEGPYIVAMGRLTRVKNFALLIAAYARSGVAPALVILGQGPEQEALEAQIAALGLQGRVHLSGFCENPYPILRGATFFVSPSRGEGFPNGLVEAMASGLAVISANCPSGPSEILAGQARGAIAASGVTAAAHGILVPVDDEAATAAAIRQMWDDSAMRNLYAQKAVSRVRDFGVAVARDRYWAVFEQQLHAGADNS